MNMIIATHNAHKIEEFGRILAPLGITVQTAARRTLYKCHLLCIPERRRT